MRVIAACILIPAVLFSLAAMMSASEQNTDSEKGSLYRDVADTAWYADAVRYVSGAGLMTGTGESAFSPGALLTRAQLITILWRMADEPASDTTPPFPDVPAGIWYEGAAAWASSQGIAEGYEDGRFGAGDSVTREQMAALIWRMNGNPSPDSSNLSAFADADAVGHWAKDAVAWAVGRGVIHGRDGELVPQGSTSRAEAAQILMNLSSPREGPDGKAYVVREGDTLSQIAGSFGITTEELALYNREVIIQTAQEQGYHCSDVAEYASYVFPGEVLQIPEKTPEPAPFDRQADYQNWVETEGYSSGTMVPAGKNGINQDCFRTPPGTPADVSGRIVIGDSRCCQLGIYQQRANRSDFAVYAVWGGHYTAGEIPPIMTDDLKAEVEACFQRQIRARGACTIYLFATVNDYDFLSSGNAVSIRSAVSAAEYFSSLSFVYGGVTCHPSVLVIGFDGCHTTAPIAGIPQETFNRYVADYNRALLSAVQASSLLSPYAAYCTSVPEITGGATTFINDGLHYGDRTLRDISTYLVYRDPS